MLGQDRLRARADAHRVPHAGPRPGDAFVIAPVEQIGRAADPDEVAADHHARRAVQGVIVAAHFLREQGAVFVRRRDDHAVPLERRPVAGRDQADPHPTGRDSRIGQIVRPVNLADAGVFNAERLQFALAEQSRLFIHVKMHPVVAPRQAQMRERREIRLALVLKQSRVGVVQVGVVLADFQDGDAGRLVRVQNGRTDPPLLLLGPLGDAQQQADAPVVPEDAGVEQALDDQPVPARNERRQGGEVGFSWKRCAMSGMTQLYPQRPEFHARYARTISRNRASGGDWSSCR